MNARTLAWRAAGEQTGAHGSLRAWTLGTEQDAPAVLLVHGLEDSYKSWGSVASRLADSGLRVIALDLPWRPGNDYRWRRQSSPGAWASAGFQLAGVERATWIGHSFGSNALLELLTGPDGAVTRAADAVVLAAPFYRPPGLRVDWKLFERSSGAFDLVIREGLRVRLGERARTMDPDILDLMVETARERIRPEGFLALFDTFVRSCELDLDRIDTPMLVLAGTTDPGLATPRAEALSQAIEGIEIVLCEDYGHFCHAEQPEDVSRRILSFLARTACAGRLPGAPPRGQPEIQTPRDTAQEGRSTITVAIDISPRLSSGRPGFEGANIRTWIGFKHFSYLAEAAVLDWFRQNDMPAGILFAEHGAGLEIVESSIRLPNSLTVDDFVEAEVVADAQPRDATLGFKVRLTTLRDGKRVTVLKGKLRVGLLSCVDVPVAADRLPLPVLHDIAAAGPESFHGPLDPVFDSETPIADGRFCWSWRIPYFYCHWSERLAHSGYVKALEEVVDRFLEDRGISVSTMLGTHGWIPVVSRARIQLLADARMEETLHTVFVVEELIKDVTFEARMDCFVERDGLLVHTATASILHGYAGVRGPDTGRLAVFDDGVRAALLPERATA